VQRRLVLLRHGESGWDGDPPSDHERVLTANGRVEAQRTAKQLVDAGWSPDRVFCSTANRARETAALLAEPIKTQLEHHQAIYSGGLGVLQELVGAVDDGVETVVVVGHNPSLSGAASVLSNSDVALSTGHAALLRIEADSWEAAMASCGWDLVDVVRP
jgi:phosphohistidine phosphatase